MPTNRTRRTRNMKSTNISPAWRVFWETGTYGNQTEEDADIFLLSNRPDDLRAAWDSVRDMIIADWKRAAKHGMPWAVREFDKD
jgi:hypothetical protein